MTTKTLNPTSEALLTQTAALIRQYLSDTLRIDVEFVENIEMVRTGKRLASVSKLPIDFQKRHFKSAVDGSRA